MKGPDFTPDLSITLHCAPEAVRYPARQFAQEKTGSLRLICKSGVLGSKGRSANWGAAGEPGQAAAKGGSPKFVGGMAGPVTGGNYKPGKPGVRPECNLSLAVTRTAPKVQGPVPRKWELWEGIPCLPGLRAANPGPEPVKSVPQNILAAVAMYKREQQKYRGQLQAVQRQLALIEQSFQEEHRGWRAARDKYDKDCKDYNAALPKLEADRDA